MSNANPNLKLNDDVSDAIRKNLPEVAANELKKFIDQAQRTADELNSARNDLTRVRAELKTAQEALSEHRSLENKLTEMKSQRDDLDKRELQLRHDTAMNRALVAEAELKGGMHVMGLVFRNATVSQTVLGTIPVPVEGQAPSQYNNGCPGHVSSGGISTTTETTQK